MTGAGSGALEQGRPRRGRPPGADARTLRVNVHYTAEELLELDAYAARAGYGSPIRRVGKLVRAASLAHVRRASSKTS